MKEKQGFLNRVQEGNRLDISEILDNFKKSVGIKTDKELSRILQVRPNTISTWRMRNSMAYERLIQASLINNVNLDRLFSNKRREDAAHIIVVPRELQFQYVSQRDKKEFIAGLPEYNLPFIVHGYYRAFEIINSPFCSRSRLALAVGKMVEEKGITEGELYTVVNKVWGIITGYVAKDNPVSDDIYIMVNDAEYKSDKIKISLKDSVEIWKVTTIVSFYMGKKGCTPYNHIRTSQGL